MNTDPLLKEPCHHFSKRRIVTLNAVFQIQTSAQNGCMMISKRPRHNDCIAVLNGRRRHPPFPSGKKTDPCRVDDQSPLRSGMVFHHLRVTGNNKDPCLFCSLCHRMHDAAQAGKRQSLFQNKSAGQIARLCPAHQKIVHRTAHTQSSDVSSRVFHRSDNKGVRRHGKLAVSIHGNQCGILHL